MNSPLWEIPALWNTAKGGQEDRTPPERKKDASAWGARHGGPGEVGTYQSPSRKAPQQAPKYVSKETPGARDTPRTGLRCTRPAPFLRRLSGAQEPVSLSTQATCERFPVHRSLWVGCTEGAPPIFKATCLAVRVGASFRCKS